MLAFSAALDFYLALYPAFVFHKLGWGLQKKITLSLVMGLGMLYVVTTGDAMAPRSVFSILTHLV